MNNLRDRIPQRIERLAAPTGVDSAFEELLSRLSEGAETGVAASGISEAVVRRSGSISGFPSTGLQPVSKEGFVCDLRDNTIAGASLAKQAIFSPAFSIGSDIQGLFNSLVILADDDLDVETFPGYQGWRVDSAVVYSIPIRGLSWIKATGTRSFNFQLVFSSQDEPVLPNPITAHQERWATQTLTKTNAAGVADDWTAVNFAASDGTTQIDPATYGDTSISAGATGAKNFISTTVGEDVNILVEGLNVAGKTWAADPITSSSGVTLADGDVSNAQTERYYQFIRMRARVDAAVAATSTTAFTSQYRGMAGAF